MSKLFSLCTLHDSAIYRAKLDCKVTAKQTNKQTKDSHNGFTVVLRHLGHCLTTCLCFFLQAFLKGNLQSFFTLSPFNIKASFSPTSFALRHLYLVKPSIRWEKGHLSDFDHLVPNGSECFRNCCSSQDFSL